MRHGDTVRQREILHGLRIAHRAEEIWGWGTPAGRWRARRRRTYLQRHGLLAAGNRVLEIGCGTGMFTRALGAEGADVVACDISWELLQRFPRNPRGSRVRLLVADAEQLPLSDHSVDTVAGVSVLHHLGLPRAVAELQRVLRPGGRIVFSEPNMLNPQIFVQKRVPLIKRWLGDTPDETAFFRWPLTRLLRGAGFRDVRVIPFDFLHPRTPRALVGVVAALGRRLESWPVVREIAGSLLITGIKGATEVRNT